MNSSNLKETAIGHLARSRSVRLTTFRKDGTPVDTPVGGVVDNGRLYVLSYPNTGKLKRLRNNPKVIVAPCNSAGVSPPDVHPLDGTGRILDREETEHAYRLMARKTVLARLMKAWYTIRRTQEPWVGIEVTL